jgi:radical SAM protein
MGNDHSRLPQPSTIDFDLTPFVAIWETTRACDLACRHCRAEAIPNRSPDELSTDEGFALLTELAEMGTPICVLSGGDPAKRPDLCALVEHGARTGMRMATIPAATPLLTRQLIRDLKSAGLAQMALSLDGPNSRIHDSFRGVEGAFELTLRAARWAHEDGMPLQINTTFSEHNRESFDEMAKLVRELGVVFWEVFFLVPMGRGRELGQMNADQFEDLFARLAAFAHSVDFIVKITEAPHYRRYLMQQRGSTAAGHGRQGGGTGHGRGFLPAHMRRDFGPGGTIGVAPKGVNSGNGYVFVNYSGEIFPSGFLPYSCGNVKRDSITDIYRAHPVFRDLRTPELLKGKCGICEFRHICGGSRARAYAMTGDYLEVEPFCAYEPRKSRE